MGSLTKVIEEMKRTVSDCYEMPGTSHIRKEAVIKWVAELEALQGQAKLAQAEQRVALEPGDEVFVVYEDAGRTNIKVSHVYATEDDALRAKMDHLDPKNALPEKELKELAERYIQTLKVEIY